MPELPEVETVRRGLQPVMEGARVEKLTLNRNDLRFPFPRDFKERIEGRRITALGRRAKYLLADMDSGDVLVMHLGMSGSFRIETGFKNAIPGVFHHDKSKSSLHDHVVFDLKTANGPARIVYNDPRRFGFMDIVERQSLATHPLFANMGIEPLGNRLNGEVIATLFAGKTAPLKAALLDQRLIAGLGNIYVCEALHAARLSPRRKAGTLVRKSGLPGKHCEPLAREIRAVIAKAIEAGGSSLRDHRQADGSLGYFQHNFRVYDREGRSCPEENCSGTIRRIVQSGRSTFYCPSCQR